MKLEGITHILRILVLTVFVSMFANTSWATHIVGGQMTYTCLGDGEYEITLTVRRDCEFGDEDADFDDPAIVGIYDRHGSLLVSLGYWGKLQMAFEGSTIIDSDLEFCQVDGSTVCVEEAVYTANVHLPYSQLGYILAYERCCRNQSLDNVIDPLNTGTTYFIELNSASQHDCNSSPVFNEWPDLYVCANEDFVFDHSATDPEGDDLVYSFFTPYGGASADNPNPDPPNNPPYGTIDWANGYSADNPWAGILSIDPDTGVITGTPNMLGQYLVGVAVDEYRDGEFLGRVYRDFELNVVLCNGNVNAAFEVGGDGASCSGLNFDFINTSTGDDDISYTWFFDYPNTTPTSNEENPSFTYGEEGTYTVVLEATSGDCTVTTEQAVNAYESGLEGEITYTVISCDGDQVTIEISHNLTDKDGTPVINIEWDIVIDGETITSTDNTVTVTVSNTSIINSSVTGTGDTTGCTTTLNTGDVNVSDLLGDADFKATIVACEADGTVIEFSDTTDSNGQEIASYSWTVNYVNEAGQNVSETYNTSSFTITSSGDQIIVDHGVDYTNGCSANEEGSTTISIINDLYPDLDISISGSSVGEDGGCVNPTNQVLQVDAIGGCLNGDIVSVDWTVTTSDGQITTYSGNGIDVGSTITDGTTVSVTVTYSNGCTDSATEVFNSGFDPNTTDFNCQISECTADGYVVILYPPSTNYTIQTIQWTVNVNGTITTYDDETILVVIPFGGTAEASVDIVYTNGCSYNSNTTTLNDDTLTPNYDISGSGISGGDGNEDGSGGGSGEDCPGVGNTLQLDELDNKVDGDITGYSWTISANGTTYNFNGNPINIGGIVADNATVTVSITYSNGCTFTYSEVLNLNGGDSAGAVFVGCTLNSCGADGSYVVGLNVAGFSSSFAVGSVVWTIDINGVVTTSTDINPVITIPAGGFAVVSAEVTFTNGCVISIGPSSITEESLQPQFNIVQSTGSVTGCPGSGSTLQLNVLSSKVAGEIVSYNWTVATSAGTFTFSGNPVDVGGINAPGSVVTVTITYSNGCSFTYTETIDIDGGNGSGNVGIGFTLIECGSDGSFVVSLNVAGFSSEFALSSVVWTIDINGTVTTSTELNPTIVIPSDGSAIVTGVATFTNGCVITVGPNTINSQSLQPTFDIVASSGGDTDCPGSGSTLQLNVISSVVSGDIISYDWTVATSAGTFTYNGNPIDVGGINAPGSVVTVVVTYSNGCSFTYTETIDIDGGDGSGTIGIGYTLEECGDDGSYVVGLDVVGFTSDYTISTVVWTIDINGNITTSTDLLPTIVIPFGGTAIVSGVVTFTNGCIITVGPTTIDGDALTPIFDIVVGTGDGNGGEDGGETGSGDGCGSQTLEVVEVSSVVNGDIIGVSWTVEIDGVIYTFTGNPVDIGGLTGDGAVITAVITYSNGCIFTYTEIIDLQGGGGIDPDTLDDITGTVTGCNDDGSINATLNLPIFPEGYDIESVSWTVDINGEITNYAGLNPEITIPLGGSAIITAIVVFTNGCTIMIGPDVINADDLLPELVIDLVIAGMGGGTGEGACDGTYEITVTADPNIPGDIDISYTINDGAPIAGENGEVITIEEGDVVVITATGTFYDSCIVTATETYMPENVGQGPEANFNGNPVVDCDGDDTFILLDGDSTYTYTWDPTDGLDFTNGDHNPIVSVSEPTLYNVTISDGVCTTETFILVLPQDDATPNVIYIGGSDDGIFCGESATLEVTNPVDGVEYVWTVDGEVVGMGITFTYDLPIDGEICVQIEGTEDADCDVETCVMVFVPEDALFVEIDGTTGDGDTLTFDSNPVDLSANTNGDPDDITWCDANGNEIGAGPDLGMYEADSPETIFAKIIDENGCTDTTSVVIVIDVEDDPDVCCIDGPDWGPNGQDGLGPCPGEEFELTVIVNDSLDYFYDWGPDECILTPDDQQTVTVSIQGEPKDYFVVVTHPTSGNDTTLMFSASPIIVDVNITCDPLEAEAGEIVTLTAESVSNIAEYVWSNGGITPSIQVTPLEPTDYSVTVTDVNGCTGIGSKTINVTPDPCDIENFYIPNAFSPNGDDQNDIFRVRTNVIDFTSFEFSVHNRWGEEVFISNDPNVGWNGLIDGTELSPDVYAYCLKVTCSTGGEMVAGGNVSLIK